jgi:spore germination protein GerM
MSKKILAIIFVVFLALLVFCIAEEREAINPGTTEGTTTTLMVFFNNNTLDPEISCDKVFPAQRIILKTQTPARAALELLFEGPNQSEKASGFYTSINPGVKINSLSIVNGVAKADFSQELESPGGSCRVASIRAEINQTLKQFDSVSSVIISINGRTQDILQP